MPALARPAGDAHSSVRAHRLNVPGRGLGRIPYVVEYRLVEYRTWSNTVRGRIPYVVALGSEQQAPRTLQAATRTDLLEAAARARARDGLGWRRCSAR